MGDQPRPSSQISIGRLRITGAAATTQGHTLRSALTEALQSTLSESPPGEALHDSRDLAHLRVRLPHGASERDVARAVAREVKRSSHRDGKDK
jgi:hypothetical protein